MSSENDNLKKFLLVISAVLGLVFIISTGFLISRFDNLFGSASNSVSPDNDFGEQLVETPDAIIYRLRRNPTTYQIELFEMLIDAHYLFVESRSEKDLVDYSAIIVRNFIADFFTLSNKVSRSDVGGLQFIADDLKQDFRDYAIDEFYLYLNQFTEIHGRDELPTVKDTTILNVEITSDYFHRPGYWETDDYGNFVRDMWGNNVPFLENWDIVVVDVEWAYEQSGLEFIGQFQTNARITLKFYEDAVQILLIHELPVMYDFTQ